MANFINGLLRDYFPKRTDLTGVTAADLAYVAEGINPSPKDPAVGPTSQPLRDAVSAAGSNPHPHRCSVTP